MKPKLCCLALLCFFLNAHSQQVSPLKIGEKVPDLLITNIINHPTGKAKISDYKGKLLILDFWATWCSPCLAMFPKTDSLQKEFGDQVAFLPVTYQSKDAVVKIFSKLAKLKNVKLPVVVEDKNLHEAFPHNELPHYVWIDGSGTIKAITGMSEITGPNIQNLLSGAAELSEKKDFRIPYDRNIPLVLNDVGINPAELTFGTILTKYKRGLPSRLDFVRNSENNIVRVSVLNTTLRNLWSISHTTDTRLDIKRVLVEVRDPSFFELENWDKASQEAKETWMQTNTFCYEITVPDFLSSQIFSLMRRDLENLFPKYSASMEKRPERCLVLERISQVDKIKSQGGNPKSNFDAAEASVVNCPVATFTGQLEKYFQKTNMLLVDGTGYKERVDITLKCDLTSITQIKEELRKYDLDLIEKTIDMDMLIIRDRIAN